MSEKLNIYTTEGGAVLRLKPVREPLVRARLKKLETEYRAQHPELDVPTYKAKTIAGEVQEIALSADGLEDPTDPIQTKVNRAKWAKHEAAVAEWAEIRSEQEYLTWLMLGVDCDLPEGWEAEVEAVGVNLPDDPLQRKAIWLHYMALSVADRNLLFADLRVLSVGSVITGEQVESFRRGARGSLEREARARFDDALAEFAARSVVGGAEAERVDDGQSVGPDAEIVGPPEQ